MEDKILNFIAKAQFKIGELGEKQLSKSSRSIRIIDKDYILMRDLLSFIDYLYESRWTIEGDAFNFILPENEDNLIRQIEAYELRAELDLIPTLAYPKNLTIIEGAITIVNGSPGSSTPIPDGGGVGFYLTKSLSNSLIWKEFDILKSDFNNI